jgi:hypothetical protein
VVDPVVDYLELNYFFDEELAELRLLNEAPKSQCSSTTSTPSQPQANKRVKYDEETDDDLSNLDLTSLSSQKLGTQKKK